MTTYLGNVLIEIEKSLERGAAAVTLSRPRCEQLLAEFAAIVESKNVLVRENNALREKLVATNVPTGV